MRQGQNNNKHLADPGRDGFGPAWKSSYKPSGAISSRPFFLTRVTADRRYAVQMRDLTFGRWIEQGSHDNIDAARESARGYSKHCDERSRIVDISTGKEIEIWNDGQLEEKNGELL